MDLKKAAAEEALKFIKPGMTIGLGAGSTIAHLVQLLKTGGQYQGQMQLCTSSFQTAALIRELQLRTFSINDENTLDIYFDGCDEIDADLNALKSGGGIHTMEKLFACKAKQFIILGDRQKLVQKFSGKTPVVAEVIPAAADYIMSQIKIMFTPAKVEWRLSNKSDGPVITSSGNYLLDIFFTTWPGLSLLNQQLKMLTGIVETSLFYNLVTKAVIATDDGIKILEHNQQPQ